MCFGVWNVFRGSCPLTTGLIFQCGNLLTQSFIVTELLPELLQLVIKRSLFIGIEAGGIKRINAVLDFQIYVTASPLLKTGDDSFICNTSVLKASVIILYVEAAQFLDRSIIGAAACVAIATALPAPIAFRAIHFLLGAFAPSSS